LITSHPRTVEFWGRIAPFQSRAQELVGSARAALALWSVPAIAIARNIVMTVRVRMRTLPSMEEGLARAVHQRIGTPGFRKKALLGAAVDQRVMEGRDR
jgi:hypothetical protein